MSNKFEWQQKKRVQFKHKGNMGLKPRPGYKKEVVEPLGINFLNSKMNIHNNIYINVLINI